MQAPKQDASNIVKAHLTSIPKYWAKAASKYRNYNSSNTHAKKCATCVAKWLIKQESAISGCEFQNEAEVLNELVQVMMLRLPFS
jgi:hypothetical protein